MTEFSNTKEMLNNVGCGFCLAKWTQVTMHLENGTTHSCHHPSPHKIPLDEIRKNPTALHNTNYKKRVRQEMLSNKRPTECQYCWSVENNSQSFSDRVFKSSEPWSIGYYDEIKELRWNADYNPKYVEVSFSNACNFKCAYCGPAFSSKWVEEIEKFGGYPTTLKFNTMEWFEKNGQTIYKHDEYNPYVESFWNWWPDLYKDLHTFRITGGEPLMAKDTWQILEFIANTETPNRNLSLSINSNLGVPRNLIEKMVSLCKKITDENRVKELVIFTSCESWGEQAEYVRFGMNFVEFIENIEYILSNLNRVNVVVMATFNALSVFKYDKLIDKIYDLKSKYHSDKRYWPPSIQLDTSYLRWPTFLSVKILDDEHKELILKCAKKAFYGASKSFNYIDYGFSDTEVQKIKRTYDYSISNDSFDIEKNRIDFVNFVDEYDKRRGTNFLETFPELSKIYNNVKNK